MTRFSLRTIFVGLAVVALIIGCAVLQWHNFALRREVEQLRIELGYLVPIDESKVNIIEVPTTDTWRWRVFAPEGTVFDAGIITKQIPRHGTPGPSFLGFQIPSERRGVLVTASVAKDLEDGYALRLDFGDGRTMSSRTPLKPKDFLDGSAGYMTAGRGGTQVCEFDGPIVLHRRRLMEPVSPTVSSEPDGPARGLMFWITPKKKP